jgi:hypothetical protein
VLSHKAPISASSSKYRCTRGRVRKNKKTPAIKIPETPLTTSRVRSKVTTSPGPLIANTANAIHQAHFLPLSKPAPARPVVIPGQGATRLAIFPTSQTLNRQACLSPTSGSRMDLGIAATPRSPEQLRLQQTEILLPLQPFSAFWRSR